MTMTPYDTAARHLVAARQARRPGARLPEACRPADVESALLIQRRVGQLLGYATGGWKCSLPKDERIIAAPIYVPAIFTTSPCPVLPAGAAARIEPEVAFVLGRDLPPRGGVYSEAEMRAAIAETRLVLELIGCRYAEPATASFAEMLADGMNNQGLFLGPVVPGGLDRPLEAIKMTIEGPAGPLLTRDGHHPSGHPLRPLFWLANFLAARGEGLTAGQVVTTGSYAGVVEAPLATPLRFRFGGLGVLSVEFQQLGV